MIYELNLVKNSTLLTTLTTEQIESYIRDGSFRFCTYGKNNMIHFSGDICSKLEIILSGSVVIERIDESGSIMTIVEFPDNEIIGGNLLFSKNPYYPMTIRTSHHTTVILEIRKERLFEIFCNNHSFLRCYLEYVSDHATILGDKLRCYINRTMRESIISYLKYEQIQQNSKCIKLNISKKSLADRIGVQRTSLSRELAKMREDGLIKYDAKTIELLE